MGRLAIIAGAGQLPVVLAKADPDALCIGLKGMPRRLEGCQEFRVEHFGAIFKCLKEEGITRLVMAGAMSRPVLDVSQFDEEMNAIGPRLMKAMAGGDDRLLRELIAVFEEQGVKVVGAHTLLPDLTADSGLLAGQEPNELQAADIRRGDAILGALSPVDVGQAVVVERGVCYGVETIQGTDALLDFVKATPEYLRRGSGVLVKRPKVGQDLRVDMPSVGTKTIQKAHAAGLSGVVISPGSVLLIDRENLIAEANKLGIFILARRPV